MIKYLLEKEFKQLLRNPMLPRMLLVFPCIILLVLPWAANFEIKNMNLSIVDNDRSPYSTRLVQKVGASEYFHLIDVSNNYQVWGIERSGFFNGREKWAKGFENQRV